MQHFESFFVDGFNDGDLNMDLYADFDYGDYETKLLTELSDNNGPVQVAGHAQSTSILATESYLNIENNTPMIEVQHQSHESHESHESYELHESHEAHESLESLESRSIPKINITIMIPEQMVDLNLLARLLSNMPTYKTVDESEYNHYPTQRIGMCEILLPPVNYEKEPKLELQYFGYDNFAYRFPNFKFPKSNISHLRRQHMSNQPKPPEFVCLTCGVPFTAKKSFNRHREKLHKSWKQKIKNSYYVRTGIKHYDLADIFLISPFPG